MSRKLKTSVLYWIVIISFWILLGLFFVLLFWLKSTTQPQEPLPAPTPQIRYIEIETPAPIPAESLGKFTITGYCACEKCCGKWAYNRPNGIVYGAANQPLVAGISAAGWEDVLPYGSTVYIEGLGIRVIQDTGAKDVFARYDYKLIDVYCGSHAAAAELAKTEREVWLIA